VPLINLNLIINIDATNENQDRQFIYEKKIVDKK